MRHRKNNVKFGRSKSHREALVAMLAVGLVKAKSIRTTARKAKVARSPPPARGRWPRAGRSPRSFASRPPRRSSSRRSSR